MSDYHGEIMNLQILAPHNGMRGLPAVVETMEYKEGYRDARGAAAEIALKADRRIAELEQALRAALMAAGAMEGGGDA